MNPFEHRLKIHDRYHLELKFRYPMRRELEREDLRVELYFFLPRSLDVTSESYSQAQFYRDLHTYTRYGTPPMTLEEMLDPANPRSPLTRLSSTIPADDQARAVYELRVFSCIVRVQMRKARKRIERGLRGSNPAAWNEAAAELERWLDRTAEVARRLRESKRRFLGRDQPYEAAQVFEYADEHLSIVWHQQAARAFRLFDRRVRRGGGAEVEAARARLAEAIRLEAEHRLRACYPSQASATKSEAAARANEYYLYREGALKKFAQSVLFLNVNSEAGSRGAWYTLYAVAAMSAMLAYVALVLIFFPDGQINSISAIVLAVVAYALKDRIKEEMKRYFSSRLTGILRDRENVLIDRGPLKRTVGRTAEAFSFVPSKRVPAEVLGVRERDDLAELHEDGAPEVVMKYEKRLTFFPARIASIRERIDTLDEISRFSVRQFLEHMDEPRKGLVAVTDPSAYGRERPVRLMPVAARKVYHANLVLRVSAPDGSATLRKYRMILTRNGIVRIEDPQAQQAARAASLPAGHGEAQAKGA
ncbi:MAG: hypothetical protein HS116_04845 [Planctomycetes bacterium]|nr:hypothetical protein [Planctomycetota bacterium]